MLPRLIATDLDGTLLRTDGTGCSGRSRATTSRASGGSWAVETIDQLGHEPGYRVRWPVPDDATVDAIEALLLAPPVKLLLRPDGDRGAAAFADAASAHTAGLVEVTYSDASASLLEMSAAGVSKGSALAALCAARGIDPSETIAFGDMPNDLPMLAWAGRSYAMANGHPEVLAAADERAPANDEDGVAAVLERLLSER